MTTVRGANVVAHLAGLARPLPATVTRPALARERPAGPARAADGALDDVLRRAVRAGHPPEVVAALDVAWRTWTPRERAQVAHPLRPGAGGLVRLGGRPAVQTSETTCGSTVLVLLAAAGDPVLAAWLVAGRRLGEPPAELASAVGGPVTPGEAEARFSAAQQAMLRATSRRALGLFSWPTTFGTPPWTAARHARFPGVRFEHRPVDDGNRDAMTRLLDWARASLERGVPVPLYSGGDPTSGLATALPRHVVLAVPSPAPKVRPRPRDPREELIAIYEPTAGRVHVVESGDLVARRRPHAALGGWTHVCWAVLPRAAAGSTGSQRR